MLITQVTVDAVYNQEGKFAFREVFTKPFILAVQVTLEILVVVTDLKNDTQEIDKPEEIAVTVSNSCSAQKG